MTLEQDADNSVHAYEHALGRHASATRAMLEKRGYTGALSRLAISADLQAGFKALRDAGKLDSTFEAVILRHQNQFSKAVIEAAKWRIENPNHLQP